MLLMCLYYSLYLQKWEYNAKIEQAKTVEEPNAIKFEFTMKDFS